MEDNSTIKVVMDKEGHKVVVIPDILFKGKKGIDWRAVKEYLDSYVGKICEIADTKDIVYIGKDLPDEYTGSRYTYSLRGMNAKAKANAAQGIRELVETAVGKHYRKNTSVKHKKDAQRGWYRYDSRFALPVYTEEGIVERYNTFHASVLVRHGADGKLYLYDILDIKKETGNSFES